MIWRLGRYAIDLFYGLDVEIRPKLTPGAGTPGTLQYHYLAARLWLPLAHAQICILLRSYAFLCW